MNSIVIVGRAVRDAEVRYSTGEKSTAFGNYTLAVDRPYKKDGEKETDFIMCRLVRHLLVICLPIRRGS